MISWIQHHLIRHGRWIFLTLLAVVIVAFVFTIGNTPGCTNNRSAYEAVNFYGFDLNASHEMQPLGRKLSVSNRINGLEIQSDQQYQSFVLTRIALLHLADEISFPSPSETAFHEFIKTRQGFMDADGEYSRDAMIRFIDEIETEYPTDGKGLVLTVLEEDYRIERLSEALAGPDYLLPSEALERTRRDRTELNLKTATLDYNGFEPSIEAEEAALNAYYEANTGRYEIAERIDASHITFAATNYLDQVKEATDEELRDHFIADRTRFVEQYEAAAEAASEESEESETTEETKKPAVTFKDVRDDFVLPDFKQAQAVRLANRAAQTFAYKLYDNSVERDSADFDALLDQANLSLETIEPFTAQDIYWRELPREMLETAFNLNDSRYYSDPYPIGDDYAILIFQSRIPPHLPPYEEVAAEVKNDYEAEEKRRLFNEEGQRLQSELKAGMDEGSGFAEAAEALELKIEEFDAFKTSEAPRELNRSALETAQNMEAGEISPMIRSGEIGLFVYLESRKVPEIAPDNEDLKQAEESLARYGTGMRRNSLINELVTAGLPEME